MIDFDALARGPVKWLCGYSDLSTLMFPFTLRTGIATLHGSCLMEAPFHIDPPLIPWHLAAAAQPGSALVQGEARFYQSSYVRYQDQPDITRRTLETPAVLKILGRERSASTLRMQGRLIGGCIDVIGMLAGTPYGDLERFAHDFAPEGLLIYLENCELTPMALERQLWQLVHAGWFKRANGILIGRSSAPENIENWGWTYSQLQALESALAPLGIPVVYNMDIGHVPPQAMLINGALATITVSPAPYGGVIEQVLI
jgi:muramoyltetrapeptide carboxypeptidase LdcA involved in peptidoglycan recycling